jgi:glycerol-3-phosphate dehydrogenase
MPLQIAVIGGGINGVMIAWQLAQAGARVTLLERGALMGATSSASSKMLHGGLRYLEHGRLHYVREALQERAWWLAQAPHLAEPLKLVFPIWHDDPRGAWMLGAGLTLYDFLAHGSGLPDSERLRAAQVLAEHPDLRREGLRGGYAYWDARMDDHALGLWAADQARAAGVEIHEHAAVDRIDTQGLVVNGDTSRTYDRVVNAAGPWAAGLLVASGVSSSHALQWVRGSHIQLKRPCTSACVLQAGADKRIVFVLPWQGGSLVGTTEVEQEGPEHQGPTDAEVGYLLGIVNRRLITPFTPADIVARFSGVRAIVKSANSASQASREAAVERRGRLVSVFGGKWTTARALAREVAKLTLA